MVNPSGAIFFELFKVLISKFSFLSVLSLSYSTYIYGNYHHRVKKLMEFETYYDPNKWM